MVAYQSDCRRCGFSLVELLVVIAIIGVLAALLLPVLERAKAKAKRIECVNNLHEMGLAFHGFAHLHQDKFPPQVSTSAGGSLEFVQAGYGVIGEFYFSFRHFQPLASELESPALLVCPADSRTAAANFTDMNNGNLSYFVTANSVFGRSDSILAGDRNLTPVSGSIGRLGRNLSFRWSGEMHRFKGNVLFADGHVEQLGAVLKPLGPDASSVAELVFPSVPRSPASASSPQTVRGGNVPKTVPSGGQDPGGSDGPGATAFSAATITLPAPEIIASGSGSGSTPESRPSESPANLTVTPAMTAVTEPTSVPEPNASVKRGEQGARSIWWILILLALVALLEIRRRLRRRRARFATHPTATAPQIASESSLDSPK